MTDQDDKNPRSDVITYAGISARKSDLNHISDHFTAERLKLEEEAACWRSLAGRMAEILDEIRSDDDEGRSISAQRSDDISFANEALAEFEAAKSK